jgi:hypothetical protein
MEKKTVIRIIGIIIFILCFIPFWILLSVAGIFYSLSMIIKYISDLQSWNTTKTMIKYYFVELPKKLY